MVSNDTFVFAILATIFAMCLIHLAVDKAAYHNGVTDGYGYAREGREHPGYAAAGEYLRKYMAHRWPELENAVPNDDSEYDKDGV